MSGVNVAVPPIPMNIGGYLGAATYVTEDTGAGSWGGGRSVATPFPVTPNNNRDLHRETPKIDQQSYLIIKSIRSKMPETQNARVTPGLLSE